MHTDSEVSSACPLVSGKLLTFIFYTPASVKLGGHSQKLCYDRACPVCHSRNDTRQRKRLEMTLLPTPASVNFTHIWSKTQTDFCLPAAQTAAGDSCRKSFTVIVAKAPEVLRWCSRGRPRAYMQPCSLVDLNAQPSIRGVIFNIAACFHVVSLSAASRVCSSCCVTLQSTHSQYLPVNYNLTAACDVL